MNGNQVTISLNSTDLDHLRRIARNRGQSISDYIARLVALNLANEMAPLPAAVALQKASRVVR